MESVEDLEERSEISESMNEGEIMAEEILNELFNSNLEFLLKVFKREKKG